MRLTDRVLAHAVFDVPLNSQDELDGEKDTEQDDRGVDKELEVPAYQTCSACTVTIKRTQGEERGFPSAEAPEWACVDYSDVPIC